MAVPTPYAQYQSNSVTTASPDKLLLMAYDGAIRFTKVGQDKIRSGAETEAMANIAKAQAIIGELMMTLNPEPAPELVANLARLYEYMHNRLSEASLNNDAAPASEVIAILTDLRETWAQAAQIWRGQNAEEGRLAA